MNAPELLAGCIAALLSAGWLVLWLRMLEDCLSRQHGKERVFWFVLLVLGQFAAFLAYYFVIWRPRRRTELGLR